MIPLIVALPRYCATALILNDLDYFLRKYGYNAFVLIVNDDPLRIYSLAHLENPELDHIRECLSMAVSPSLANRTWKMFGGWTSSLSRWFRRSTDTESQ